MSDRTLPWAETVAVFERRGLPESSYRNLYDETYDVRSGSLEIPGPLDLDARDWTSATGVVVDGDLTVRGSVLNVDDGCPALVVLGDLRAADVYLEGDVKLLVLGSVTVDGAFIGNMTDKLVMVHGDLKAAVTLLSSEFAPDLIGGTLHGPVLAPRYLGLGHDLDPAAVLVPEVLRAEGDDPDDLRCFDIPKVHGGRLLERIEGRLPVVLG
ncbi:hypothetical protein [Streptomyces sp. NPDC003247]|uniref:hypothetical protein n=1 Tax=Streptomyces sp. NPDC003247 TaxID=3364677 RepID=UPI003693ED18